MFQVNSICSRCGREFTWEAREYAALGFQKPPRICPECADKEQGRPEITVSRRIIWETVCRIESLPPVKWQEYHTGVSTDRPCFKATIKGREFGASWSGRIDLYAVGFTEPPKSGEVVELADMEVVKRVGKKRWERQTLHHGTVYGWSTIPLQEAEAALKENPDSDKFKILEESRRYVRLMPAPEEDPEDRILIWRTAHTKTTLKGFGRQYHAHFEGEPLWNVRIRGGYRSGRAYTVGILAVVSPDAPLIRVHREGGAEERVQWPED